MWGKSQWGGPLPFTILSEEKWRYEDVREGNQKAKKVYLRGSEKEEDQALNRIWKKGRIFKETGGG